MSSSQWVQDHYEELVRDYSGYCVLVRDNKVVFSDKSYETVLDYAEKNFIDGQWAIKRIENGKEGEAPTSITSTEGIDYVLTEKEALKFRQNLDNPDPARARIRKNTLLRSREFFNEMKKHQ